MLHVINLILGWGFVVFLVLLGLGCILGNLMYRRNRYEYDEFEAIELTRAEMDRDIQRKKWVK